MSEEVEKLFGKLVDNVRLSSDENALGKVLEILHREKEIASVFKHVDRSAKRNASTLRAVDLAAYCRNRFREEDEETSRRIVQLRSVARVANDVLLEMSTDERPKKKRKKCVATVSNLEICLYQIDILDEMDSNKQHDDIRNYLIDLIVSIGIKSPSVWFGTDPIVLHRVASRHEKLASSHLDFLLRTKAGDETLKSVSSVVTSYDIDARLKSFLIHVRNSPVRKLCESLIRKWGGVQGKKQEKEKLFMYLLDDDDDDASSSSEESETYE
jgi:hypothetical protein